MACGICHEEGHDRRTCPHKPNISATPRAPGVAPRAVPAQPQQAPPAVPRSTRVLAAIGLITVLAVGVVVALYIVGDDGPQAAPGSPPARLHIPAKPKR